MRALARSPGACGSPFRSWRSRRGGRRTGGSGHPCTDRRSDRVVARTRSFATEGFPVRQQGVFEGSSSSGAYAAGPGKQRTGGATVPVRRAPAALRCESRHSGHLPERASAEPGGRNRRGVEEHRRVDVVSHRRTGVTLGTRPASSSLSRESLTRKVPPLNWKRVPFGSLRQCSTLASRPLCGLDFLTWATRSTQWQATVSYIRRTIDTDSAIASRLTPLPPRFL